MLTSPQLSFGDGWTALCRVPQPADCCCIHCQQGSFFVKYKRIAPSVYDLFCQSHQSHKRRIDMSESEAEALVTRELWRKGFVDSSQFCGNKPKKRSSSCPQVVHSATKEASLTVGWSNPAWVEPKPITFKQGTDQLEVGGTFLRDPFENCVAPRESALRLTKKDGASMSLGSFGSNVQLYEAIEGANLLEQQGNDISHDIVFYLLRRCIHEKNVAAGREVHALIKRSGFESDTFLGSHLIRMFGLFENLYEANAVFTKLSEPNVFSWGAIVSAHVKVGQNERAIQLYEEMQQSSVKPDGHIFVEVLKACSSMASLTEGKKIHVQIIQNGLDSDAFVGSSLIDMYVKGGNLKDARMVFDRLTRRDVVIWSMLMSGYTQHGQGQEALKLFEKMRQAGMQPDQVTFVCVLTACSLVAALEQGRWIHNLIIDCGYMSNPYVGNALINMYAKCGSLDDAQGVFDLLPMRNVVTWSSLIAGYVQHGVAQEAFHLFEQMQQQAVEPDDVTFICILKACSNIGQGRRIHAHIMESHFELDLVVGSALIDMYANCGCLQDAQTVFDTLPKKNVVTWSALIAGYTQHGHGQEAFQFFEKMQQEGIEPNLITFVSILKACSFPTNFKQGSQMHTHIIESGLESNLFVGNALIDMYAKCGSLESARMVFEKLPKRDVVTWSTLLGCYAEHSAGLEAVQLFEQMQQEGMEPNSVTFICILKVCSSIAALEQGRRIHAHVIESGLDSNVVVGNSLIDMYAKCGNLEFACIAFNRTPKQDVATWSVLISGYARHCDYSSALKNFMGLQCAGLKPDDVTFLCLLSACSHVGLVDEGCLHFKSMREDHFIIPTLDHCNCMVDILGHAGCLTEVEDLLETIPFGPNIVGWTSLLSSCRTHANVDIASRCFNHVIMLDHGNSSGYVLMSNIYAHAGMWTAAEAIEELRRCRNGWKKPAQAFIEIDNQVHEFSVGDQIHPQSAEIYAKLDVLNIQMRAEGYNPRLDLVLGPMSNEEKQDALCGHSEKLAIAFGLICSPQGSTIRVAKNLRMCSDCHNAAKLISRIEMREIIVTDTYCIHHFQDGVCSCKDYCH